VGILRPAILLPPSLITGLGPQQLEMLLLHELAHLRRWDNLINLLQRIVESLLCFQPTVWLVSRWVRQQRELCCDAVVIRHIEDQDAYAEVLLAAAQNSRMSRQVAVSAVGAGGVVAFAARSHLGLRIRRILTREDEKMTISRKAVLFVMLAWLATFACIGSFGLSWSRAQRANAAADSTTRPETPPAESSTSP